ncbi:MAG: cytochrome c biogenesis protein ResB [Deltaproteobacteria bacterium]|nr:cytochrome c biogenesis protein ResB [Deltaproteobacteria bacterium]
MEVDIRPIYKRIWDFLGSRDLSVFIFVMGMTYFLILAIFGIVAPLPSVTNISKLLPYKVLYILFFINLLICEIKWIPVIIRRCRKPRPPETADEMARFRDKIVVSGQWSVASGLEKYLRRRGYKIQGSGVSGQGSENPSLLAPRSSLLLYAYKGRFSPIGNLLFHISFLFLLIGVGLSIFYRFDGTLLVAEGQGISGEDAEYISSTETEYASPPDISFKVEKITPAFWKDMLLFTDLKADMSFDEGKGRGAIRLSQPLRIAGARVTITGIGITPLYILKDDQGMELARSYVNLSIFLPGSEGDFQILDSPYRVRVSFYPDFELKDGKGSTRSMNPVNPTFEVMVSKNWKRVFKGFLKPDEEARFDDLSLSFPEFKYNGIFRVVYDRGFVFIWTGFILMIAGLAWRLVVYRKEIVIWEEEGKVSLSGRSDYYQNLFVSELRSLPKYGLFDLSTIPEKV